MNDLRNLLNNNENEIVQLDNVNKEISSLKLLLHDKEVETENLHDEKKIVRNLKWNCVTEKLTQKLKWCITIFQI